MTLLAHRPEFQAVILCGTGHHLYPLTEPNHLPKALLPIAGKPMIGYVLTWLEREGIYDVIVVAHKTIGSKLSNYLHKMHVGAAQIDLVLQEVSQDEEFGTLDALLLIKDRIKSDFILLSCDIISDISMAPLIETFRLERPSILTLLTHYSKPSTDTDIQTTEGSKSKQPAIQSISLPQTDEIIITDSKGTILLGLEHKSGIDSEEEFQLPFHLLYQLPLLKIRTDLYDPHVYVISRYMLQVMSLLRDKQLQHKMQDDDVYTSFREEFVSWWVKTQYHSPSYKLYEQLFKCFIQQYSSSPYVPIMSNDNDICDQRQESYNHDMNRMPNPGDHGHCRIHILHVPQGQVCFRANTLPAWSELNRFMARTCMYPGSVRISPTAEISTKTQIGNDSMVGDHTRIGDRCSIKKSIVGSQCVLGSNVKLSSCVIMDYVTLEDNVKLDNVIVCQKAIIREKASLKDCEVGVGYIVERELVTKGETLVDDYRYHGASGTSMVSGSQSSHPSMNRHYGHSGSSLTEDTDTIPDLHIGHP